LKEDDIQNQSSKDEILIVLESKTSAGSNILGVNTRLAVK